MKLRTKGRINKVACETAQIGKRPPSQREQGYQSRNSRILQPSRYRNTFSSFLSIGLGTYQALSFAFWTENKFKFLPVGSKPTLHQSIKYCPIAYMGQSCLLPDINKLHPPSYEIPFHTGNKIILFVLCKCGRSSSSNIWV